MTDGPNQYVQTQTSRICRPGNLTGYRTSASSATLTWDEPYATCNLCPDAVGYEVSGEGFATLNISRPPCEITGLDPAVDLHIEVRARAAGDNVSDASFFVIPMDQTPPSRPEKLIVRDIGRFDATLMWNASTDNVGVAGYWVISQHGLIATVEETRYHATNLNAGTPYTIRIRAVDTAGNLSPEAQVEFQTLPMDQTPPSRPENLAVRDIGYFEATLTWDASTDNVGVAGYQVLTPSGPIDTVKETRYHVTLLDIDTPYMFKVRAVDDAGNFSPEAQVEFRTLKDVTPPGKPTGLVAINVSSQAAMLVWATPVDDVRVTHNVIVQDGRDIATIDRPVESSVDGYLAKGLTPGMTYRFAVVALDAAGNRSAASNPVIVQTPVLDPPQAIEVINITKQGFELRWSQPLDSIGISGYRTQIDNHAGSTREVHGPLRRVQFIGLRSASSYSVEICAHDVSDRYSAPATLEVMTLS